LGKYDEALKRLVEILKARNALLDAQREAAFTYQAWGRLKPEHYLSAIRGGVEIKQKDGGVAYLIWGWGGIARRVQDTEAHQDTFDEARYNLALCRLSYALTKSGREKTDLLREAERDILLVQMLRPEMGGKKWYDQYDAMLRKIQKALGMKENEQGLKAAEKKLPAAKAPGGDSKAATTD
jgi:hypothetical protein